jgi:hypothetical protein
MKRASELGCCLSTEGAVWAARRDTPLTIELEAGELVVRLEDAARALVSAIGGRLVA